MNPGLLFVNFGGPTNADELEPFLANLFEDVLPLPGLVLPFVAKVVASRRKPKVLPQYEAIGFSPLVADTKAQMEGAIDLLETAPPAAMGMMFTPPTVADAVAHLRDQGADAIVALGLFPHYSLATTGAAYSRVWQAVAPTGLPVHFVPPFYDHPEYIRSLAATVRAGVEQIGGEGPIDLLFSPHGLPLSFIRKGDPYPEQARESIRRVVDELAWTDPYHVGWQSRVGPVKWLTPSTDDVIKELGAAGRKRVLVVPISFVGEHIETLYEIDVEYRHIAEQAGITWFGRAPAVGVDERFLACLADLAKTGLAHFGAYKCMRCLVPKPDQHRRQVKCPNCAFTFPAFLREAPAITASGEG